MEKKFDNKNKISVWEKVSQKGKTYFSGTINIEGTDYHFKMFENTDRKSDKSPIFTGRLSEEQ